jgi:peptidoglycan lytic transglycosylase G
MHNILKQIEKELDKLSASKRNKLLSNLRKQVDGIDKEIVELLNARTLRSILIGRIKRSLEEPTYNPEREKEISEKISAYAKVPLTIEALGRIYERIIDESRAIQNYEATKGNINLMIIDIFKFKYRDMLTKKQFIFVGAVFIIMVMWFFYIFFTPNYYKMDGPIKFEIEKGETLSEIVDSLYERGIIPNKLNMKIATFVSGADKRLRTARYFIPNGLSYLDLVNLFVKGSADFQKEVYIRDGLSIKWLAYTLKKDADIDSASFVNLAMDKSVAESYGINADDLQGYLMPGNYWFYDHSPAREVIERMIGNFKKFMVDSLRQKAKHLGFTLHDVLTLASIVKGETNKVDEMPTIAKVYYNRLKIGMPLQADPTVQYAQPDGWKKLNYHDLQINSPYNTYKYTGLPPGPINNPGKNAILAVLYPDSNNYLYFVANGEGGHNFSETYSKHLRQVAQYKRWLRSRSRK